MNAMLEMPFRGQLSSWISSGQQDCSRESGEVYLKETPFEISFGLGNQSFNDLIIAVYKQLKTSCMNKKEDIIILGRGGHAKVIIDMIEEGNIYNIIGITDVDLKGDKEFFGYPILGNDDVLPEYFEKGVKNIAVGIGGFTDNNLRKKLFTMAKELGFYLPPIIHSSAIVSKRSQIGEGSVVKRGVIIDTEVTIGANNILELGAIVGHESQVGDHVLLSANVMISAYNVIGDGAFFAVASTIVSGARVCEGALIGAGAVVVQDITERGLYIGVPAKRRD